MIAPHQQQMPQQRSPQPQPTARSLPVSVPAFRRALSFVGLDQGFELFGPDAPSDTGQATAATATATAAKTKSQPTPPRIQNIGQLGQQLRQHLMASNGASSSAAASFSAAATSSSSVPALLQRAPSSTDMSDALSVPEIASPPPAVFEEPADDDNCNVHGHHNSPGMLDYSVHSVGAKDQVLGAIPHMPLQPQPQLQSQQQQQTIFAQASHTRWGPLSSSAPSHYSFGSHRHDSGASSVASSSQAGSHATHHHRRRLGAHTPTTVGSDREDANPRPNDDPHLAPLPLDDDVDEAAVDALVSHTFHGDISSCSLSSCSTCSSESSDFSAQLEDDFDVALTFAPRDSDETQLAQVIKDRLNQTKREHHNTRHLHHRRLKARAQLRHTREEARARGGSGSGGVGGDDDWKSAQLNEGEIIRVGSYTPEERQHKIQRYLEKRRRRVWSKKILYSCRKNFADKRPRVGGRFVKLKEDDGAGAGGASGSDMGAGGAGVGLYPTHALATGVASLSTSPAHGFASHGMHALTQHMHMHGAIGGPNGGSMTPFSLPLSSYTHTNFSPAGPSSSSSSSTFQFFNPLERNTAGAAAPAAGALSFYKQEAVSSSATPAASSGLAAAFAPKPPGVSSPFLNQTN